MEQLARMGDQLKSLAERQAKMVSDTESYENMRRQSNGKLTIAQRTGVRGLGQVQRGLKDETGGLIEQLEGAPVFSLTLKRATESMEKAAARLQAMKTDDETQKAVRSASHRFEQLIDSLKADDAKQAGTGRWRWRGRRWWWGRRRRRRNSGDRPAQDAQDASARDQRANRIVRRAAPQKSKTDARADRRRRAAGQRPGCSGRPCSRSDQTETGRWGGMIMIVYRSLFSALALAVGLGWCASSVAQDTGKTQDEALDSLLEKLEKPGQDQQAGHGASTIQERRHARTASRQSPPPRPKPGTEAKPEAEAQPKPASGQAAKPADRAKTGSGDVSSQDKDLDALLEKLGETKDEPAPEERPGASPAGRAVWPLEARSGRRWRQAKRKPSRRIKGCKAKTRRSTRSSRNSPARSARRRAASRRREAVRWARSSRRCGTSSSGWASRRPVKIPNPSRSESSSRSRRSSSR